MQTTMYIGILMVSPISISKYELMCQLYLTLTLPNQLLLLLLLSLIVTIIIIIINCYYYYYCSVYDGAFLPQGPGSNQEPRALGGSLFLLYVIEP